MVWRGPALSGVEGALARVGLTVQSARSREVANLVNECNGDVTTTMPISLLRAHFLRVAIHVMKVTDREAGGFSNPSQEAPEVSTANCVRLPQRAAINRTLVWIEQPHFRGFGCSECGRRFEPSGAPTGTSFDEMMRNFELQRDKEFTSHVCADHPRNTSAK